MQKMTVYRYDDECFAEGQEILPRGDSFNMLTDHEKKIEREIRSVLSDGENVRSTSLYGWEDEAVARRLWKLSKKTYLYELEVEQTDVRFKADLHFYSEAVDAVKQGASPDSAVRRYCSGESAGPCSGLPRIEVLVTKAKVIRRFCRATGLLASELG
jgi:hypothetical protein